MNTKQEPSIGQTMLADFVGGMLATLPMTLLMLAGNRLLPAKKPQPLPPESITKTMTRKAGVEPLLPEPQKKTLSLVNHFLYGGVIAVPVGLLTGESKPVQAVQRGIGYGLFVWFSNYLGLLPALKLYPPATREPARMNGLMILSHVVWGGTLGWLTNRWCKSYNG